MEGEAPPQRRRGKSAAPCYIVGRKPEVVVEVRVKKRRRVWPEALAAAALTALLALWFRRFLSAHGAPWLVPVEGQRWAHLVPEALRRELTVVAPEALYGLCLVPWFVVWSRHSLADLAWPQRALSLLTRVLLFGCVLLALARPTSTVESRRVCTVFVVDVSASIGDEALARFHQRVEAAVQRRGDNLVRVVTFAREAQALTLREGPDGVLRVPPFARPREGTTSDLAGALALSYGLFPPGVLRRVVLLSDGVQTEGDVLGEASRAARFGVKVSTVAARGAVPAEVAVRSLRLPDRIRVNEPFEVRATVFASRPTRVQTTLMQGNAVNGLDPGRGVSLDAGERELTFRSVVRVPGDVTYALRVTPEAGADRFAQNNRYVTTATVPGRPTVLYVEGDPARGQWFRAALAGGDFEVESRGAREFPQSLAELERFDFVVLSDVAAEDVSAGSQAALGRYLRELGGGFLMAGGARGFGLGGWSGTEVERLLPLRMESQRRRDEPSLALCLVIDHSGSMQGTPLVLAQSAALATARALGPDDVIEVITFDVQPDRVVRMQSARNRVRIENELRRIRPGGGTAIFPALDAAHQDLALTRATTRHVILLTDGQGQPDEPARLRVLADAMAADGVTVSTVGLGPSVDRELLETLAHRGHGRSYFTAEANNLPQIFLRETNLVARSAAVEDPVEARVVTPVGFVREAGGAMPLLYGYVSTRAKPEPAQRILDTDTGEPLMARWRVGLGWSLAWTSDLKNRWAVEWIRWPRWAAFWSQLVREHMRSRQRHDLAMRAEMVGASLRVAVDAITPDDRFDNTLTSEMTVRDAEGRAVAERVAMRVVAPGRYEAELPSLPYGAFRVSAVHRRDGSVVAQSETRVSNPYPAEYQALAPDLETLSALAAATRGVVDPSDAQLFDPGAERVRARQPVWRYPLFGALALLLVDLVWRRVRVFDRGFASRPRRGV